MSGPPVEIQRAEWHGIIETQPGTPEVNAGGKFIRGARPPINETYDVSIDCMPTPANCTQCGHGLTPQDPFVVQVMVGGRVIVTTKERFPTFEAAYAFIRAEYLKPCPGGLP